jgi:hypothetical protein
MSVKRNWESEKKWKPGVQKEKRNTKLQVQKARRQQCEFTNAKFKAQKRVQKCQCKKFRLGVPARRPKKSTYPALVTTFIISELIHTLIVYL